MVWVLRDLTFKQVRMANPYEQKLRKTFVLSKKQKDLSQAVDFTITLDDAFYSDEMLEFLCTILCPEMTGWSESIVTQFKDFMANITESTLEKVLDDYFNRKKNGKNSKASDTESLNES